MAATTAGRTPGRAFAPIRIRRAGPMGLGPEARITARGHRPSLRALINRRHQCDHAQMPATRAACPSGTCTVSLGAGDRGHPADCYLPVRSRCLHPGQQQGRRWPSSSSSSVRRMRRSRVISCLASSTQQMNSLRARGVMSFQASRAVGLAISALRRSPGSLCTNPPGTRGLLTGPR